MAERQQWQECFPQYTILQTTLLYYPLKKERCLLSLGWSADSSISDQLKNHSSTTQLSASRHHTSETGSILVSNLCTSFRLPAWIHLRYTNIMCGDTPHVLQGKKKAVFSLSRQPSPVLPAVHLSQPHRYLRLQGGDSTLSLISQGRIGDDPLFRECRVLGGRMGFFFRCQILRNQIWLEPIWFLEIKFLFPYHIKKQARGVGTSRMAE